MCRSHKKKSKICAEACVSYVILESEIIASLLCLYMLIEGTGGGKMDLKRT